MATVCFMKRIIEMTDAETDQEHLNMLVAHAPSIPDRTAYILDPTKDDPAPAIIEACKFLERAGVEEIAIPCVTAHFFKSRISKEVTVPVMDGVVVCADYLKEQGIRRVGILATDGTIRSGIVEKTLESREIDCVLPTPEKQKMVMDLIYQDVKSGRPVNRERFAEVARGLRQNGADVVLLGCTELSVAADEWLPEGKFVDLLSVLARACVMDFGKLKKEYETLI